MSKMRTLKTIDLSYFETAPVRDHLVQSIPASAEATFRCLEDGDAWGEWIGAIRSVTWTSPKPWGVGTTRTVNTAPGKNAIDEEFLAWEDGRRMAFFFVQTSLPLFAAFGEDYVLTPTGDNSCELRWSWAFENGGVAKYLQPVVNGAFKQQGKGSLAALAEYMRSNGEKYQG